MTGHWSPHHDFPAPQRFAAAGGLVAACDETFGMLPKDCEGALAPSSCTSAPGFQELRWEVPSGASWAGSGLLGSDFGVKSVLAAGSIRGLAWDCEGICALLFGAAYACTSLFGNDAAAFGGGPDNPGESPEAFDGCPGIPALGGGRPGAFGPSSSPGLGACDLLTAGRTCAEAVGLRGFLPKTGAPFRKTEVSVGALEWLTGFSGAFGQDAGPGCLGGICSLA